MPEINIDRYISSKEACEYLGVNKNTLLKMITEQKLPGVKIGKLWKFKKEQLDKWVEEQNKSK